MKFNSLKEYFYRLNSVGYQALMVPLILFIFYYAQSFFYEPRLMVPDPNLQRYILVGLVIVGLVILTLVQWVTVRKANQLVKQVSLGLRLEQLGGVLINRMIWQSVVTLLMPLGQVITGHFAFTIGFGVGLVGYFLFWPTPERICRLLKLKGDERQLVISRGEAF